MLLSLSELRNEIVLTFSETSSTVESPNNGHVGDMASVRCRELSASRRLLTIIIFVAS